MANIAGVNLPANKQSLFALRYIFGIGPARAKEILDALKIDGTIRMKDLNEDQLAAIRGYIDENFVVESDLAHEVKSRIRAQISLRSLRGIRHQAHLPVRGQNTHGNANTRKKGRA